jgi:uncharacterized protein (DUF2235 family)
MARNIVLCCDGTANEFARDRTNVVKLFYTLIHDPLYQATYYHPGLGTMEAVGALTTTTRKVTKMLGYFIGYGLEVDIRDAYVFLMNQFLDGDRVFLFGFSRGAYTVRCVAALLHMYGLIRPGNEPLVPYAIRMMMAITALRERKAPSAEIDAYFDLAADFKQHFCIERCDPYFVGVWDTVSSIGWIETPVRLPYTADSPNIAIGRHAVAIDERRAFFRSNLWHPTPKGGPKDLKQVWFPGAHGDVGGGYPEAQSAPSKVALKWMLDEAKAAGLLVDAAREDRILGRSGGGLVPPDPRADIHDSLSAKWWLAEFVPKRHFNFARHEEERRMNLFRRRTVPSGSLIHASAYGRGAEYDSHLPADAVRVA